MCLGESGYRSFPPPLGLGADAPVNTRLLRLLTAPTTEVGSLRPAEPAPVPPPTTAGPEDEDRLDLLDRLFGRGRGRAPGSDRLRLALE